VRPRPKGAKYKNLVARGNVIYYQRVVGGRRSRFSCRTDDWSAAAEVARLYEQRTGVGGVPFYSAEVPRFRDFAEHYLAEDMTHLAGTTQGERRRCLRPEGPILTLLGDRRLDEITPAMLRAWWVDTVEVRGRSTKTGRNFLDAIGAVFAYAQDLGILRSSPVPTFREQLRRHTRTKRGRAETQAGRHARPIEDPTELERLVESAREEGLAASVLVLLLLDAGLRLGEALGLRWGRIVWGVDENDRRRALLIQESRPRGGAVSTPKSGRGRRVALSRRLQTVLATLHHDRFAPGPEALVLEGLAPRNFRNREWRRILERAAVGHRALKDLRDTYASQLLTAGVQLGYV
jgi:integrase